MIHTMKPKIVFINLSQIIIIFYYYIENAFGKFDRRYTPWVMFYSRGYAPLRKSKSKNLNISYKALERLQTGVQAFHDTLRAF